MSEIITKDKIDFLINTLITSGGGKSQYGKLNDIIKTYTTENSLIRNTLLIWLDTMGIIEVDSQNNYFFKKPIWVKSSIKDHFILYGAVTQAEKRQLELNHDVLKYTKNKISFKNFEIELPDTYYTLNHDLLKKFDYHTSYTPIFSAIQNMEGLSAIKEKLYTGKLEKLIYPKENPTNEVDGYKLIMNDKLETLTFFPQYDIKQFNWRTRNYMKCEISRELNIEPEEEGLKLIKVTESLGGNHKEYHTILLEKAIDQEWYYYYFDRNHIDERWARYLYIDKLEYYDIEQDFKSLEAKVRVYRNAEAAHKNGHDIINPDSSNFMKISDLLKKQLVQYDSRQGLIAFPVSMPLPKEIMRYLFACSGIVPQVFKHKFIINPDFNIKRLFSGVLSDNGYNVDYPDQKYFMEEDFYLFSSVPTELAEMIFEKLNLDIKDEVFKTTFLQKV
jgi:hypothetical protein